jgi:outer membrane protein TolC
MFPANIADLRKLIQQKSEKSAGEKIISMKNKITILAILLNLVSYSQTLEDYLKIAKENNSDIKTKNTEFELAIEKIYVVSNYENTELSLGVFALTPETRVGSQLFKIGANQKLPWFGEFETKRKLQTAKAAIKKYDAVLSERDLYFKIKKAYYELYQKKAITSILAENKQILNTYENMSLAALSNNRAKMSDVLKIRVQKNELQSKIQINDNDIIALSKNFNRLLQRDSNTILNITDSLDIAQILITDNKIENHPILEKINARNRIYKSKLEVIDIDKKPKISVGLDYILVNKRNDLDVSENGKDILMPKISLSIPIFNGKKFTSRKKQTFLEEDIVKSQIENQKYRLKIELESAKLTLNNSIISSITALKNKNEMQRAINVDLKAFETGILDYDNILRLQLQKIKYQLQEIVAIKKAFIAKSKIEYLIE